jgi:nucleoside-diphosphate-sugar epimerase
MKEAHPADRSPVCVTGATGMIGRRIVQRLLARGYPVRALVRGEYARTGVQVYKGALADEAVLEPFIDGAGALFHCAAELKDPARMQEVNVAGTERIVRLLARNGARHFCHISSAGVVGRTSQQWVDESTPCDPQNAYERTKLDAERIASRPISGCATVILRPTNVVDENHLGDLGLPASGSTASRLKALVKGAECAHIVHADDVADAALYFLERPAAQPRLFFVSLDEDPLNTVGNLWSLYRALAAGREASAAVPIAYLPLFVPHVLRKLRGTGGNSGAVRYSSKRLVAEGFEFSLGVAGAVRQIILDRSAPA